MERGEEADEARGGVGARLRSARERAGLSAIQAAEKLHVDTVVLKALEAEQFDELGAPVYVRGYIRHYADLVRESPAELDDLYGASGHAARLPDLTRVATAVVSNRSSSSLVVPGIVIVVAVALIGMGWWIAGTVSRAAKLRHGTLAAPAPAAVAAAT
ncbi:MAG: helix-turn-helix domain-containing protein, partial [Steroidobacteraceae bacterium]